MRNLQLVIILSCIAAIAGCKGGAATEELPPSAPPPSSEYTGPPPATSDVQSFKINVWDNVRVDERCSQCHVAGGQSPEFARLDDVNMAYQDANTVVNLASPGDSQMVAKVSEGHHCWLASDQACVDILTTWISAWAGEQAVGGVRKIEFEAPVIREVGVSKNFPASPALFAAELHPMLQTYCSECHSSAVPMAQSPYFADEDLATAYAAVQSKIDLDVTMDSRLVVRLRDEFHNCWSDCAADAGDVQDAIDTMALGIPETEVDPELVTSKALRLPDGIVAAGGNRFEANVVALYEFKTGSGTTAFDTSGVDPAIDLTLSGDTEWVGGWGIELKGGKAQGTTAASRKLKDLIGATGEYSIEGWVVPGNVTQEEARIISYSAGPAARNFTLGQTLYNYDFFNRSSMTDGNGTPALSTADADEDLQATLQHVVVNFDPVNGRSIFVNGEPTGDFEAEGGSIADWDDTFALVLGNEVSGDGAWLGTLRMVAIHNRLLTPAQVRQNFDVGVGEKFYLLFSVSDLVGLPDSYIYFEVSQFDSYAYLFTQPTFISLDETVVPDAIAIEGMRIGVNGAEAEVGQVWSRMATSLSAAQYNEAGQQLSPQGTIIAVKKGADNDEFFLTFDRIGSNLYARTPPAVIPPPVSDEVIESPDIGIRTFAEINATLAAVTGVSAQHADVVTTYDAVKQQLPQKEAIDGFVAAHQVGVAQMAIEYCNALIDDVPLRDGIFPAFDFSQPAADAYDTALERDAFIDPLLGRLAALNLVTQPLPADTRAELAALAGRLTACGASCPAGRTEVVAKGLCAAVTGSAVMLVQ
ncbi:MAG: LamG domain-containing protein [Gammaproteobacteria bacterium]|nr:LamG domain-containing protein [Gammaproteobacteria bacterium]NNM20451.1 LamG domain-containing protein [Gammaproteobacteria bacterium]